MPKPIGPGTTNRELARTLRAIWPEEHRRIDRIFFVLTRRQWDALQEAAERIGENPDEA